MQTNQSFTPQEIGIFTPNMTATSTLETGQVGYVATGLKIFTQLRLVTLSQMMDTCLHLYPATALLNPTSSWTYTRPTALNTKP